MYGSSPTSTAMIDLHENIQELKDLCNKYAFYIYEYSMTEIYDIDLVYSKEGPMVNLLEQISYFDSELIFLTQDGDHRGNTWVWCNSVMNSFLTKKLIHNPTLIIKTELGSIIHFFSNKNKVFFYIKKV